MVYKNPPLLFLILICKRFENCLKTSETTLCFLKKMLQEKELKKELEEEKKIGPSMTEAHPSFLPDLHLDQPV
jgi:hypothetical protein